MSAQIMVEVEIERDEHGVIKGAVVPQNGFVIGLLIAMIPFVLQSKDTPSLKYSTLAIIVLLILNIFTSKQTPVTFNEI